MRLFQTFSLSGILSGALLIALLGFPFANFSSLEGNDNLEGLKSLYIVTSWEEDFYPYWASSISFVEPQKDGLMFKYIKLDGSTQPCNEPDIKARSVFRAQTKIGSLVRKTNLCNLDPQDVEKAAFQYAREPELFETTRLGVVLQCGNERKVFRLPSYRMDRKALKRHAPEVLDLFALVDSVDDQVFKNEKYRWDNLSQELGEQAVPDLRRGKFDSGFWSCSNGEPAGLPARVIISDIDPDFGSNCDLSKFHSLLADYNGPAKLIDALHARLVNPDQYTFLEYEPPRFGQIAYFALIQGKSLGPKVQVNLAVDRKTGKITEIVKTDGHPLLVQYVLGAVKTWRFDPVQKIQSPVMLEFEFSIHDQCFNGKHDPDSH